MQINISISNHSWSVFLFCVAIGLSHLGGYVVFRQEKERLWHCLIWAILILIVIASNL